LSSFSAAGFSAAGFSAAGGDWAAGLGSAVRTAGTAGSPLAGPASVFLARAKISAVVSFFFSAIRVNFPAPRPAKTKGVILATGLPVDKGL
jgi:hypothetical protein